jgi:hypothetical protein
MHHTLSTCFGFFFYYFKSCDLGFSYQHSENLFRYGGIDIMVYLLKHNRLVAQLYQDHRHITVTRLETKCIILPFT